MKVSERDPEEVKGKELGRSSTRKQRSHFWTWETECAPSRVQGTQSRGRGRGFRRADGWRSRISRVPGEETESKAELVTLVKIMADSL